MLLFKGYIRSSRLFLLAERPDSALRMVEMASERVSPDDVRRVERLALLRTEIKAALDVQKHHSLKKVCHISKLPFEVLSEIMLLAVDTKQPQPLSMWIPYPPAILAIKPRHRFDSSMCTMEEHCNKHAPTLANPSDSNKKSSGATKVVDTEVWRIP